MERFSITKKDVVQITEDTYLLTFNENLNFKSGQFVMLDLNTLTRKPFTIGKFGEELAISVIVVGDGSAYLVKTDKVTGIGPLGNEFSKPEGKGCVIVAPSCFAEGYHISREFNADLVVASRKEFSKDFREILNKDNLDFAIGNDKFVKKLESLKNTYDWYFVSGSKKMEEVTLGILPKEKVYVSLNEYMACGIGACKGCAVETRNGIKHVCQDGPVFRGDVL